MATKKLSVTTQLKNARLEETRLRTTIEELEKKLKSAESTKESFSSMYSKINDDHSQIHAFLDAVPNPPISVMPENQYSKLSLMTRLSLYFATRFQVQP